MLTIGTQAFTASLLSGSESGSGSEYIIGSQTLVPGAAAVTVGGVQVSLEAGGSGVIVGGSTISGTLVGATTQSFPSAQVITIGTKDFTASLLSGSGSVSGPEYVVGSQTLVPGAAAVTVGGVQVSLEAGGSGVVVGGSTVSGTLVGATTESLNVPTATASKNATGTYSGVAFTAGARRRAEMGLRTTGIGIGLGLLGLVLL